jgi:hypothetical protein
MNREAHLRETLPKWLALPFVAEIIVVDWSNCRSLRPLTGLDERVRVIRVVAESSWLLSHAFNLGISHATNGVVIKCDADAIPAPALACCEADDSGFYAGHWRSGRLARKLSMGGQCVVTRAQFQAVNGYSELIRSYGRDDADLYGRLMAAGFERREISPRLFEFIEHSNEERLANQAAKHRRSETGACVDRFLSRSPAFFEMMNFYITQAMPWGPSQQRAQFESLHESGNYLELRRRQELEIVIPAAIESEAREYSTRIAAQNVLRISEEDFASMDTSACRDALATWLYGRPDILEKIYRGAA